jgi:hypothetical protein
MNSVPPAAYKAWFAVMSGVSIPGGRLKKSRRALSVASFPHHEKEKGGDSNECEDKEGINLWRKPLPAVKYGISRWVAAFISAANKEKDCEKEPEVCSDEVTGHLSG